MENIACSFTLFLFVSLSQCIVQIDITGKYKKERTLSL